MNHLNDFNGFLNESSGDMQKVPRKLKLGKLHGTPIVRVEDYGWEKEDTLALIDFFNKKYNTDTFRPGGDIRSKSHRMIWTANDIDMAIQAIKWLYQQHKTRVTFRGKEAMPADLDAMSESNGPKEGEYTTEEMDAFMTELIDIMEWSDDEVPRWKKVTMHMPSNSGRNASSVSNSKEEAMENWAKAMETYAKDENLSWYVWNADVGGSLNKPKQFSTQRYDIDSIIEIVRKYPDAIRKLSVSVDSDQMRDFADYMRKEWYTGKPGNWTGD